MKNEYLLSTSVTTSDYGVYLKDAVNLIFSTEQFSIPGSTYGFSKSMSGVDRDLIEDVLKDRIQDAIKQIDTRLKLKSSGWDPNIPNDYNIVLELNSSESYEITIQI